MPRRHMGGGQVWLHSFFTSALDRSDWSTCRQPPPPYRGKNRTLGGPNSQSRRFEEQKSLFSLTGFEQLMFQPVA